MPQIDKRVELVCIAAGLADIKGSNDRVNPTYANTIDKYFSNFKKHPFIDNLPIEKATAENAIKTIG